MFKVLHKTPQIPDSLSSEGKDFLHKCFKRNPAERPTAAILLEHPFIRNAGYYNAHGAISPAISAMKISVCSHLSPFIYLLSCCFTIVKGASFDVFFSKGNQLLINKYGNMILEWPLLFHGFFATM
jgi:serine/threonine protein kinase